MRFFVWPNFCTHSQRIYLRYFVRTFLCVLLQVLFLWVFSRGLSQYALLRGFISVHSFAWAISTGSFAVGFFTGASTMRFLPGCFPCVAWQGPFLGDTSRGFYPCALSFDPIWRVFLQDPLSALFRGGFFPRTTKLEVFPRFFFRAVYVHSFVGVFCYLFEGFFAVFFHELFGGCFSLRSLV